MANEFYMTVEGAKQGRFKGEGRTAAHKDAIAAFGFSYEVNSPRDPATGQPTGKRQHHPITITKDWGASSPQFFQALVTNEVLKTVLFEFVRTTPNGVEEIYYTILLTTASVSDIRDYTSADDTAKLQTLRFLEDISFTFQKIAIEDKVDKTQSQDDWTPARP